MFNQKLLCNVAVLIIGSTQTTRRQEWMIAVWPKGFIGPLKHHAANIPVHTWQ